MEVIVHSIESIASIILMIALGIVLAKGAYFGLEGSKLIAFLVTRVSLPCLVLLNITNNFSRADLGKLGHDIALPLLSVVISYLVAVICCRILQVPKGRRAIFKAMFYVSNCIYIGLPLNAALFGEQSTVYVLEYFMVNTTALWCVAVYDLARDGAAADVKFDFQATLKKIIFSPLLGFITAIILILLNVTLPGTLKDSLRYLSTLTTPLSMFFIGIELSKTKLSELGMNFEMLVGHLGRFVVGPLVMFACYGFFHFSDLHFSVMVMQAAMPVAVALPLLAATYGADVKYATILTSTSTVLFVLVVPFYMWVLQIFLAK